MMIEKWLPYKKKLAPRYKDKEVYNAHYLCI